MASGTLAQTPFAHLLIHALDRRLTGTLVIEEPAGGKSAVSFDRGLAQKVRTASPVAFLRDVLLELNAVDVGRCDRALHRAAREQRLHGQVLLAEGAIDAASLRSALREQLHRKLLWLFALPQQSAFGYYDTTNYLERFGAPDGPHARTLALIWRGIREHGDAAAAARACATLGPSAIRLHRDAELGRFSFDRTERTVLEVLRAKPQSLSELVARDLAPAELVQRLLYTLMFCRQLDLGSHHVSPVGVGESVASSSRWLVADPISRRSRPEWPPDSVPPSLGQVGTSSAPSPQPSFVQAARPARTSSAVTPVIGTEPRPSAPSLPDLQGNAAPNSSPEAEARKAELRERANSSGQSYYDVLGVPREASTNQIQAAFFQLAKKWHPDRLGPEFHDVRGLALKAFARITEAHQILTDTARRADYDEVLARGGGSADEQEKVQAVLRAAMAFQRAEVLLKKNNLEAAEKEARSAVTDDPDQPDYEAVLAWIEAQRSGPDVTEQIGRLTKALKKEPDNLRARWYRAQLYKRMGRDTLARSDFRQIIEVNPNHLDATRELRLYEMRRSSRPPPTSRESGKGLLDKLFKR
jgi:curved DNA-binding protein CbpA